MGATDEEVLMVVESQATRLSELDDRNRSIMNENSVIKSVLLKSKEDMGAMRSQMEQMTELLKMMITQGAMKTSPPNPEGSSTQCELDRGAHEGAAMGEGDPGTCSKLLTGVSLALPRTPSPVAKQKSGGDDMRISPQESEKPKGTEVEDNKHGGEGKLRMDKYAQLGGDVRDLRTDSEGEEMADHTAGRAKRRTTSPQTKSGGADDETQIQSGTMEGEAELGGTPQLASTECGCSNVKL